MKMFELIRISDLKSFYVIAKDEIDAIRQHIGNKGSTLGVRDPIIGMEEMENGYLFKHIDEVYWVKKQE
ncbi:MAG: hypothetical protein ACOX7R_09005 [Acetivibrionales bacterium]|jgi:hypothetical protein